MIVKCVDPRTDSLWTRLVEASESSVFHSPAWIRSVSETYGFEPRAVVLVDGAEAPKAGMAYCPVTDVRGDRVVSFPFSDFSDPIVRDAADWAALTQHLAGLGCPASVRCVHNAVPLMDEGVAIVKRAKWHGLDLEPDIDTLWSRLPTSTKYHIRKAGRDGVVVRSAEEPEDMRQFFLMHLKTRKYKYQLLAQPFRFFEQLWANFIECGSGQLLLAYHGDRLLAGDLFLEWQGKLYYKINASSPAALKYRPNDLLMWEGISLAKTRGCSLFDFGLSDWDQEGLLEYKRKFATEEKTISFLRIGSPCSHRESVPEIGELLGRVTDFLTNPSVPDEVTEQAGAAFYRYFV